MPPGRYILYRQENNRDQSVHYWLTREGEPGSYREATVAYQEMGPYRSQVEIRKDLERQLGVPEGFLSFSWNLSGQTAGGILIWERNVQS
jgi:hypothetical protein